MKSLKEKIAHHLIMYVIGAWLGLFHYLIMVLSFGFIHANLNDWAFYKWLDYSGKHFDNYYNPEVIERSSSDETK